MREALPSTGAYYKRKALEYLSARNFYVYKNSDVEGTFEDAILKRKDDDVIYLLETKATKVNIKNEIFVKEFIKYFIKTTDDSLEKRKFILIALDFSDNQYKSLFEDGIAEEINKYIEFILKYSNNEQSDIIRNVTNDKIIAFFKESEIITADERTLEIATEKIIKKPPIKPTISDAEYSAILIKKYNENKLIHEKDILYSNLIELNMPNFIYIADSKYNYKKEIFDSYKSIRFPFFQLINKKIYTFCLINEKTNFKLICDLESVTKEKLSNLYDKIETRNIILYLLYKWVESVCFDKKLKYDDRTESYYFIKKSTNDRPYSITWKARNKKTSRDVIIPMKSKEKINFWSHRAVKIDIYYIWNNFCLQINPRWLFSSDGMHLLDGDKIDKLDRRYRKSNLNRNMNQFNDFLFWSKFLFSGNEKIIERYFLNQDLPMIYTTNNIAVQALTKPNIIENYKENEFTITNLLSIDYNSIETIEEEEKDIE